MRSKTIPFSMFLISHRDLSVILTAALQNAVPFSGLAEISLQ